MTKLQQILNERNLLQGDLIRMIYKKSGFKMGRERISRICSGNLTNFHIESAVMIAEALDVEVDKIIELKNVRKTNK